jgi:Spy/CpxP family protein refolding chaperone
MRKTTLFSAAAIVLVALIAVPFAFAQRGRGMHADGGFGSPMFLGHLSHAKQALGLSDQQVSDIKAVFQNLRQQNEPYRTSMRATMQQVAQTLINNPNDIAAAQSLIDQRLAMSGPQDVVVRSCRAAPARRDTGI